jgi:hypothetical protein
MRYFRITRFMFLLALIVIVPLLSINLTPKAHADVPFSLNPVPAAAQEGATVSLVLSATNANPSTLYQFIFSVTDPSGKTVQSKVQNFTTSPSQNQFTIVAVYPSPSFPGSNSLVGQYLAKVDELTPLPTPTVAQNSFILSITDSASYQRTQTMIIQASGYNASESVTVTIRTQTTSTLVFSALIAASGGDVATSWKIPVNATIDTYVVTLTGTSTFKNPADTQRVPVSRAIMIISSITSLKSVYQRTDVMSFSFQPTYPDGSIPSTGVGLLTLAGPGGKGVTLTATYDGAFQTFDATYLTSLYNQTGTWTASLGGHAYSDAYGNNGPGIIVTNSPQLTTVPLTVSITTKNATIAVGQQLKFNATVTYPDGTALQSGTVRAYLLYSGTPPVNDTVPVVFDSTLGLWVGSYSVRSSDTGGLWSLIVKASDSPTPPNTGSASRAITVQNDTGNASFPLFYFGIIAALLALLLVAVFLAFRRRKTTHARLKIDLDAVRTEAGRIESTDFFKSVKDQVHKEKDDTSG